jgi:hypothetical protein
MTATPIGAPPRKKFLNRLLGDRLTGLLDWRLRPGLRAGFGGPFNGQEFRRAIFAELIARVPFGAIVETGTFRGTTTEYMRSLTSLPIHTVEIHPRFHAFADQRLRRLKDVHLALGDSRSFMQALFEQQRLGSAPALFYLDAHWESDLPLVQEVNLIFAGHPNAVVLIDDFEVPGDPDYNYDDYGGGKALTLQYLGRTDLAAYFPARPGREETGNRRGCVVLAGDAELVRTLDGCTTLRRHRA